VVRRDQSLCHPKRRPRPDLQVSPVAAASALAPEMDEHGVCQRNLGQCGTRRIVLLPALASQARCLRPGRRNFRISLLVPLDRSFLLGANYPLSIGLGLVGGGPRS
jgi:hypothetical protein